MTVVEGPGSEKVTEWIINRLVVSFLRKNITEIKERLTGYISVRPSDGKRFDCDVEPLRGHHPSRIE